MSRYNKEEVFEWSNGLVIDCGTYDQYMKSSAWKSIRRKALGAASHKCINCGKSDNLEVHHEHYNSLGREELGDLSVLCASCHVRADRRRELAKASETRYWSGLKTYVEKKYNLESEFDEEFEEEFEDWLESKGEGE